MKRCLIALTVCVLALVTVQVAAAQVPGTGVQTVDQSASSDQAALAASGAAQTQPSNTNVSIRVLSPGDDGSVSQTNSVDSDATASNENSADQDATQEQSSGSSTGCCASGTTGVQTADQSAGNEQAAAALSLASQTGAKNTNVPIRVGSEGDNGDVSQTNSVESEATASNENSAEQSVDQEQSAGSGSSSSCCTSGSTGVQTADQKAENEQGALAASKAEQSHPENTNVSIRVLSDGDNGDVEQTNSVDSEANASNENSAEQSVDQDQSSGSGSGSCCKSGSTGVQTADQDAENEQKAIAASAAKQDHPKNTNVSIRVLSPGDDGDVEQTNSVDSEANASNENAAEQSVDQDQSSGSAGSTGIQTADQMAKNDQDALGLSLAAQKGASNKNIPIRVKSEGDNGDVEQTNSVDSEANASNENSAEQSVDQDQSSGSGSSSCCKSGSTGIQTAGQKAENEQDAAAASLALQEHAKNTNAPIRVHSDGDAGDVEQTNSVDSEANASNENSAEQSVDQDQSSGSAGSTGVQTADQKAKSDQGALGLSLAAQKGASNSNKPVLVKSEGDGGDVEQTNSVDSEANASNENSAEQSVDQEQSSEGGSGSCCKSGSTGIQVAGQEAENEQKAIAASLASQEHAKNTNAPIRVLSEGDEGDVEQTNSVDSEANASNENSAEQSIDQDQSAASGSDSRCCSSGTGIQVGAQEAKNEQDALGLSLAAQKGASNSSTPIRVKSDGDGGDLEQSNSVDSEANASNENSSEQSIDQEQSGGGGSCKCHGDLGIQVAGQRSTNDQDAGALSLAFQEGASNKSKPLRVLSEGDDGDVEQSNSVDSEANAENSNDSDQSIDQEQRAGGQDLRKCCSSGLGIQVTGQESKSEQRALVAALAFQIGDRDSRCGCPSGASNLHDPVRVKSPGEGGDVEQSNEVDAEANSLNSNEADQDTTQEQSGGVSGLGIQVAGQASRNAQLAAALTAAIQKSPSNATHPLWVLSRGGGGSTEQENEADAEGSGENENRSRQSAHQAQ
jgi:trimeric autotransporter adhesin